MKKLTISRLNSGFTGLDSLSDHLDELPRHLIDVINWTEFSYLPDVKFSLGYDEENFYLKFFVKELHPSAVTGFNNGPVWEDSCCEFFVAFDDTGYYNIETNCIGAQLMAWHPVDGVEQRAGEEVFQMMEKASTLGASAPVSLVGDILWQLTMKIPVSVFFKHPALKLKKGMTCRANFYKCGDKTRYPHFVSWNPVDFPEPSFHQPGFFGEIWLG
jgi:hypothetical protein